MFMKRKGANKRSHKKRLHTEFALLIGLVLLFSLFVGFADFNGNSSVTGNIITGQVTAQGGACDGFFNCIKGAFSYTPSDSYVRQGSETISPLFAKYILFFMITMIIFWIIGSLVSAEDAKKRFWTNFGKLLFSLAVATLSIGFITFDQIYSIMTTYSALGLTLSVLVPFVLIMTLASKLAGAKILTTSKLMIQRSLWGLYSVFLIYFLINLFTNEVDPFKGNTFLNIILLILALISLFFTIWNHSFVKMVRKYKKMADDANSKAEVAEQQRDAVMNLSQARFKKYREAEKERKVSKKAMNAAEKDINDMISPD